MEYIYADNIKTDIEEVFCENVNLSKGVEKRLHVLHLWTTDSKTEEAPINLNEVYTIEFIPDRSCTCK
jgi:hypothetical protein